MRPAVAAFTPRTGTGRRPGAIRGGTVATLVAGARLGHAWSGGADRQAFGDRRGPDASRMVWAFAARPFGA